MDSATSRRRELRSNHSPASSALHWHLNNFSGTKWRYSPFLVRFTEQVLANTSRIASGRFKVLAMSGAKLSGGWRANSKINAAIPATIGVAADVPSYAASFCLFQYLDLML